jgi:hypothetical protein
MDEDNLHASSNINVDPLIDQDKFLRKAKGLAVETYNKLLARPGLDALAEAEGISRAAAQRRLGQMAITGDDVFVTWFSKTLQNWKALVSTTVPDDHLYFEITYNGDKKESYVDVYDKIHNVAIPDINQ